MEYKQRNQTNTKFKSSWYHPSSRAKLAPRDPKGDAENTTCRTLSSRLTPSQQLIKQQKEHHQQLRNSSFIRQKEEQLKKEHAEEKWEDYGAGYQKKGVEVDDWSDIQQKPIDHSDNHQQHEELLAKHLEYFGEDRELMIRWLVKNASSGIKTCRSPYQSRILVDRKGREYEGNNKMTFLDINKEGTDADDVLLRVTNMTKSKHDLEPTVYQFTKGQMEWALRGLFTVFQNKCKRILEGSFVRRQKLTANSRREIAQSVAYDALTSLYRLHSGLTWKIYQATRTLTKDAFMKMRTLKTETSIEFAALYRWKPHLDSECEKLSEEQIAQKSQTIQKSYKATLEKVLAPVIYHNTSCDIKQEKLRCEFLAQQARIQEPVWEEVKELKEEEKPEPGYAKSVLHTEECERPSCDEKVTPSCDVKVTPSCDVKVIEQETLEDNCDLPIVYYSSRRCKYIPSSNHWIYVNRKHPRTRNNHWDHPHRESHIQHEQYPFYSDDYRQFMKQYNTTPKAQAAVNEEQIVDKEINTIFMDQREIVGDQGMLHSQITPTLTHVSMPEMQYHVRNILAKPLPIWHSSWSTGDTVGKLLKFLTIPGDVITGQHKSLISTFTYFRATAVVRFQVNGTKFHAGRIIAAFLPMALNNTEDDQVYPVNNYMTLPHVFLDASMSNSGVLKLPFCHIYTYFNTLAQTRKWQYLGNLSIKVFNQLKAADATATEIGIAAWIHFEDVELHQPTFSHDITLPTQVKAQAGVEGLVKTLAPLAINAVGNVAGACKNMDKPTDPMERPIFVPNAITGLSHGDGLDRCQRLSLQPASFTIPTAELINTTKDDMNLLELIKIPTNLHTYTWANSQAQGTRIFYVPVCPNYIPADNDVGKVTEYSTSMIAYTSRAFKFWRGSLRYKIQVIASQLHTGRLMFSYSAGYKLKVSQGFEEAATFNTLIMDLQERHEIEFTVPFMCERPWLRCDRLENRDDNIGLTQTSALGWLSCYVLNKLSQPTGTSPNIDINIFVSAGDDFELAVPGDLFGIVAIGKVIKAQSSQETVTTRQHDDEVTLGAGSGFITSVAPSTMSENAMNLKTVLRRYSKVINTTVNKEHSHMICMNITNTPMLSEVNKFISQDDVISGVQCRTLLAHFGTLFTFWRGSLRYKILITVIGNNHLTLKAFHVPGVIEKASEELRFTQPGQAKKGWLLSLEPLGVIAGSTNRQASLEFEVPFYTAFPQLIVNTAGKFTSYSATGTIYLLLETDKSSTLDFTMSVYQAAGDDFLFNYLRVPPLLQFPKDSEHHRVVDDGAYNQYQDNFPVLPQAQAGEEGVVTRILKATPVLGNITRAAEHMENITDRLDNATRWFGNRANLHCEDIPPEAAELDFTNPIQSALMMVLDFVKSSTNFNLLGLSFDIPSLLVKASNVYCGLQTWMASTSIFGKAMAIVTLVSSLVDGISGVLKNHLLTIAHKVMDLMNGSIEHPELPRAQSETIELVAPLVATLSTAAAAIGFKKIPTDKETQAIVKDVNDRLRLFNQGYLATSNLRKLWDDVSEWCQAIINIVLRFLAPSLLAQIKMHENFGEIEEWAEFIDKMDTENFEDRMNYDTEFKKKLFNAIEKGEKYRNMLIETKLTGPMVAIIRDYIKKAKEIQVKANQAQYGLPVRKDPFCICLFGESGIGKSECITPLGNRIMDNLGYQQFNRWCQVNCTDQYFNRNYNHQSAVYFDDFSAMNTEEQYNKFFNLKANAQYPLVMAEIEKKSMNFNSDFIFMTTNVSHPRPNCVQHPEALLRRRDVLVETALADSDILQAARGNRELLNTLMATSGEDREHLKFRIVHSVDPNGPKSAWMTFPELVVRLTDKARTHLERQETVVRRELQNMGYVIPLAQSGDKYEDAPDTCDIHRELITLSIESDALLNVYAPEMWQHVKWSKESQAFYLETDCEAYITEEWIHMQQTFIYLKIDLHERLKRHSRILRTRQWITVTKGKVALQEVKSFFAGIYQNIVEAHPWIKTVMKWGLYIVGGLAGLAATWKITKVVAHKCTCSLLRGYGFRCGFCGKWPAWENVEEQRQDFLLDQWRALYGNAPYKDGHVTPLQEESALLKMRGEAVRGQPYLGTEIHAQAYNTQARGLKPPKMMAHGYNQGPRGLPQVRHMAHSQKEEDIIYSRVFPYMYRIRTIGAEGSTSMGMTAFAIGDRNLMFDKHLFNQMTEGGLFQVHHNGDWITQIYSKDNVTEFPGKDLIVYKMDKQFHQHRNNTRHFISEKELGRFQSGKGFLCKLSQKRETQLHYLPRIQPLKELHYEQDIDNKTYPCYVQDAWMFQNVSSSGDCGAVLVAESTALEGNILGILIAGDQFHSYAQLITREMIERTVGKQLGTPIPKAQQNFTNLIPEGHFGRIGTTDRMMIQNGKSKIHQTEIHGLVEGPYSFPSVLSKKDTRLKINVNPYHDAMLKYSKPAVPFPPHHRDMVNRYMQDEVRKMTVLRKPKVLTWEQVVEGLPYDGYEPLNLSTSPGYPWVLDRPAGEVGKSHLIKKDLAGKMIFMDPALITACENREKLAKLGERCQSVWTDCLKDETRPLEKIEQGKTRIFTIPPIDYSMVMRKYTLDFAASVQASRSYMECKVGINCHSAEWHFMYKWLAENSMRCVAGDFSRFDGSMPPELIDDCRKDIDAFYRLHGECTEEDERVREVLFDELIHTVHIVQREYYMTHIGNKSGNPLTAIINSLVNKRYMILAWLGIAQFLGKVEYLSTSAFEENVRMAIYGDDNLLSIKEEVIEWFNQESISEYLAEYNIVYTNEQKNGITKYKTLDECTFLKQAFADHAELILKVPHMKHETIVDILNYSKGNDDPDELLCMNIKDSLKFAYFRGPEYFKSLRDRICGALRQIAKPHLKVPMYHDYHNWFLKTLGYTVGENTNAQGFLEEIAHTDDTEHIIRLKKTLALPLMWMAAKCLGERGDDGRVRSQRGAIVIPSGEGKTWLCQNFPDLFVDHDDCSLPQLERTYGHLKGAKKWAAIANDMLNPQHYDTHQDDTRILLTHHRNFTNRTILGEFILPKPNYNRNNYINRRLIKNPQIMDRDLRNLKIINIAKTFLGK